MYHFSSENNDFVIWAACGLEFGVLIKTTSLRDSLARVYEYGFFRAKLFFKGLPTSKYL